MDASYRVSEPRKSFFRAFRRSEAKDISPSAPPMRRSALLSPSAPKVASRHSQTNFNWVSRAGARV
ncbi:MAG: hypothetical protein LAT83_12470 [Kiritimatiellae bacterium]|nr:hypothetical protein [Kiritimatiellia bacterium]